MNMRSYNIESDGQLFKMQQESIRRTREAHMKALQAEAAKTNTDSFNHQEQKIVLEDERQRNRSRRQRSIQEQPESNQNMQRKHEPQSQNRDSTPHSPIIPNSEEKRESLFGNLLGGTFDDIKGLLSRVISDPGKLLGDLPFLSKDTGIGKLLGSVRFDDLLLLGLLILLFHDDADWEVLLILGFLFIAGL